MLKTEAYEYKKVNISTAAYLPLKSDTYVEEGWIYLLPITNSESSTSVKHQINKLLFIDTK